MSEALLIALLGAAFNGAVTWGVVATKLAWMRRDIEQQDKRTERLEKHLFGV